jgi:hypothetical protein
MGPPPPTPQPWRIIIICSLARWLGNYDLGTADAWCRQVFGKLALMTPEHKQQHWIYRSNLFIAPEVVITSLFFALLVLCNMLMWDNNSILWMGILFLACSHILVFWWWFLCLSNCTWFQAFVFFERSENVAFYCCCHNVSRMTKPNECLIQPDTRLRLATASNFITVVWFFLLLFRWLFCTHLLFWSALDVTMIFRRWHHILCLARQLKMLYGSSVTSISIPILQKSFDKYWYTGAFLMMLGTAMILKGDSEAENQHKMRKIKQG